MSLARFNITKVLYCLYDIILVCGILCNVVLIYCIFVYLPGHPPAPINDCDNSLYISEGNTPETKGLHPNDEIAVFYIDKWIKCKIEKITKYGTLQVYNEATETTIVFHPGERPADGLQTDSLNKLEK